MKKREYSANSLGIWTADLDSALKKYLKSIHSHASLLYFVAQCNSILQPKPVLNWA